jgi:hypothetical protein
MPSCLSGSTSLTPPHLPLKCFYADLTFSMPSDYKGTPAITLIAPGRAATINDLSLTINRIPGMRTGFTDDLTTSLGDIAEGKDVRMPVSAPVKS